MSKKQKPATVYTHVADEASYSTGFLDFFDDPRRDGGKGRHAMSWCSKKGDWSAYRDGMRLRDHLTEDEAVRWVALGVLP